MLIQKIHNDVIKKKNLPEIGDSVMSKKHHTYWKVVEKSEVWKDTEDDPDTGEPRVLPAIKICYSKLDKENIITLGKKMCFLYTLYDNTFESNWEVVRKR